MASRTLQEIRRAVGRELGDVMVLTATANGDTTTLIDANNLYMPNNALRNRVLYFTSGTNEGLKRIVSANTQSTTRCTWATATTVATATDDTVEMWNTRGTGFDPVQEVNTIINDTVRKAAQYVWVYDTESIGTFDQDTPYFSLPAGTRGLYAVEYQDAANDTRWHEIPRGKDVNRPGWTLERGSNIVWIIGLYAQDADGKTVRIRRYTDDAVLASDSDTIDISFDYLVAETKASLLEASFDRAPNERGLFQRWQKAVNEANYKRAALGKRIMPGTLVVD